MIDYYTAYPVDASISSRCVPDTYGTRGVGPCSAASVVAAAGNPTNDNYWGGGRVIAAAFGASEKPPNLATAALLSGETVEQAVAAGAAQIGLTAAAIRPTGRMR